MTDPERASISLRRRIDDLLAFNVSSLEGPFDSKLETLAKKVNFTLAEIFGRDSAEYCDYLALFHEDLVSEFADGGAPEEFLHKASQSILDYVQKLESLIDLLEERRDHGEEREAPDVLAGRGFHSEVVEHCNQLFSQKNYFHAVFEACKVYNKAVKAKAQSTADGADLMLKAWGCDNGVLKITPCQSDTDRNIQDGVKFLSAGLMRAMRNPVGA